MIHRIKGLPGLKSQDKKLSESVIVNRSGLKDYQD
jgi:hypothetical protein